MTERSAALGIGTLAAAVTALPALPRASEAGANPALALLALTGGTALVIAPALMFAGAVQAGTRSVRAVLLGLALAAAPLLFLAQGLKQATHHRPLGAATFAMFALALVAGFILVAWRLLLHVDSGGVGGAGAPPNNATKRVVFGLACAAALGGIGFVLVRALAAPALVPHVLDGLRALATGTLAHLLLRFSQVTRIARRGGAPLWVFVVAGGLFAGRGSTGEALRSAAPVLGGPMAWF